ncbi:MAG: chemotaxis protein CheX [Chloroflexi bacterium]|nr:chemotaxis protein CheX [Chloroflexota bacterium]
MNTTAAVAPEIERELAAPPQTVPKAEHLEPFVAAARDVLEQELGMSVEAGQLAVANTTCTTHEVTTIIGITGELTGMAMYGMSEATALAIVGQLMGAPVEELDDLALSGIGELANVITGCATTLLAQLDLTVDIAPPVLLQGAGSRVSTAGIRRLVVPLMTDLGTVEAQLAVKEKR